MNSYIYKLLFLSLSTYLFFVTGCKKTETTNEYPNPTLFNISQAIPNGFPQLKISSENPLTVEGIALGRRLFYDPILSLDSTISCSSCHNQINGFSDSRRFSEGVGGLKGTRQSMPIFNLLWSSTFFWDGRATTASQQALMPIQDPVEMHEQLPNVINKLQKHTIYPDLFGKAFGNKIITSDKLGKALEQFVLNIVSVNSKFDSVYAGKAVFTQQEQRGLVLFLTEYRDPSSGQRGGADCFHCHGQPLFTSDLFSNNGLDTIFNDLGRGKFTANAFDNGKFKVPTLRNIEVTAPYMHDGRFSTLRQAINHYNVGLVNSTTVDPVLKAVKSNGMQLLESDLDDLEAFLKTLTDYKFLSNSSYKSPF